MTMIFKWKDKEQVAELAARSISITDMLRNAGLSTAGSNFKTVKRWLDKHNINTQHFEVGYAKVAQYNFARRRTAGDIFCEHSNVVQCTLRKVVIRDHVIEYKCAKCGNVGEWCGAPLTLQLDHINGINGDNRIENLRWLCPNCHTQTDTFGSKNTKT